MTKEKAQGDLDPMEWQCALAYVRQLAEGLGDNLFQVWLYGSAARGDMWPDWAPMHSDIDLLVLTRAPVVQDVQDEFVNATYPFFLECGRQLSPQFQTVIEFENPSSDQRRQVFERIRAEGKLIYER